MFKVNLLKETRVALKYPFHFVNATKKKRPTKITIFYQINQVNILSGKFIFDFMLFIVEMFLFLYSAPKAAKFYVYERVHILRDYKIRFF